MISFSQIWQGFCLVDVQSSSSLVDKDLDMTLNIYGHFQGGIVGPDEQIEVPLNFWLVCPTRTQTTGLTSLKNGNFLSAFPNSQFLLILIQLPGLLTLKMFPSLLSLRNYIHSCFSCIFAFLLCQWSHSVLPRNPHNREQEALLYFVSSSSSQGHLGFFLLPHSLLSHQSWTLTDSLFSVSPENIYFFLFPLPYLNPGHLKVLLLSSQQSNQFSWLKSCPLFHSFLTLSQIDFSKILIYLIVSFPCLKS